MDVPVLTAPLAPAEIAARLDSDGMVSGLVAVDVSDLIDGDLEYVLDLLSERLVGSSLGMEIDYQPVHVQDSGALVMRVTLDPSMILDEHEQES